MQTPDIVAIVHKHYPAELIMALTIDISPINKQIDGLKIIFMEEINPDWRELGKLIDALETNIIDDEYGDMTEMDFKYSTYEPIPNDGLTCSFTFTFNIDS